jgi:transcriptional regulator with XRE-family HTH domain
MDWWERIQRIRVAKCWSQAELVRRVQKLGGRLTPSYLNQIERGRARNAGIAVLTPIPDALEVPQSAVLGNDHDARLERENDAIAFVTEQSLGRL